jgi:DUF917 family protein
MHLEQVEQEVEDQQELVLQLLKTGAGTVNTGGGGGGGQYVGELMEQQEVQVL